MSSIRPSILPSSYYPAYFKLDMNIGLHNMNPLAKALDDIFLNYHRLMAGELTKISPDSFEGPKVKEILSGLGLLSEELDLKQTQLLYKKRLELFKSRNRIQSIDALAKVYFDHFKIQKGWPYEATRIQGQQLYSFRLLEPKLDQKVIFIRTEINHPEKLLEEFKKNCELFLPSTFRVVIGGPKKVNNRPYINKIQLNLSTKLNSWRI